MDRDRRTESLRHTIGNFYVGLAHSIFGGVITSDTQPDHDVGTPDLIIPARNQVLEVKGSYRADRVMLHTRQIDHYDTLSQTGFKYGRTTLDKPEVYYALFYHKVKPVFSLEEDELKDALRKNTQLMITLPFQIIKSSVKKWDICDCPPWPPFVRFRASYRTNLLKNSGEALKDLDLNPEEYDFSHHLVSGKRYKGQTVSSFNWMQIHHKKLPRLRIHVTNRNR